MKTAQKAGRYRAVFAVCMFRNISAARAALASPLDQASVIIRDKSRMRLIWSNPCC